MTKDVFDSNPQSHAAPTVLAKPSPSRRRGTFRRRSMGVAAMAGIGGMVVTCLFVPPTTAITAMADPDVTGMAVAEPISPVPPELNLDDRKVQLGRRLFADSRLSGDNGVSCASCHILQRALSDGDAISRGLPGFPGNTHTLSLFNVGLNTMFGWDGGIDTLEDQARRVVESKSRMGAKWDEVVAVLKDDVGLRTAFAEVYRDGLQRKNVIDALVQYEKSFITPNAPFDRYLRGDQNAISEKAKAGYHLFKDYGCSSCHQGTNVGGNMLQVFGIFGTPDAAVRGAATPGSAKNTGISDDRPVFRVPSLRNVEYTGPYFHDGSVKTLSEAIQIMAKYQLGRRISDEDAAKIEAFLDSLTGEYLGVPVGSL
jgi:cytochrome c peroxidase